MVELVEHVTQNQNTGVVDHSVDQILSTGGKDSARAIVENMTCQEAPDSGDMTEERLAKRHHRVSIGPIPPRLSERKPPVNYGAVEPGAIFRSAFPAPENYSFIKSVFIKTVITLVEEIPEDYADFLDANGIRHFRIHVPANKDGVIKVTQAKIEDILSVVMNRRHHPILIHCNRGKHRTGCVVASLRKVQSYTNSYATSEYEDYAFPKARPDDVRFIESFDPTPMKSLAIRLGWMSTPPPEPTSPYWNIMKRDSIDLKGHLELEAIANIQLPPSDGESGMISDEEVTVEEKEIDPNAYTPIEEGGMDYGWSTPVSDR